MNYPIRIIIFLTLFLSFLFIRSYAQNEEIELWIESIIADAEEDVSFDLNTLLEEIEFYLDEPFNINNADKELFRSLLFLSDIEIDAILSHRDNFGEFLDILELQSVKNLSLEKIRLLKSLSYADRPVQYSIINEGRLRDQKQELYLKWRRTIETQKGFTEEASSPFLGDPNRYYIRYKYTAGNKIQFGFTGEKDPGEPFFTGINRYGFDFYSAHLKIDDPSRYINRIIVGDYALNLGQGLISFMGFGANKSAQVMRIKMNDNVLRPYTSVSEFNFLRGAAIDFNLSRNMSLKIFGSYRNRDSNLKVDTVGEDIFVSRFTSLPLDGFHRTANEAGKKGTMRLIDFGGSLSVDINKLDINLNILSSNFQNDFDQNLQRYREFSGLQKNYVNTSLDYSYIAGNINFFGEIAFDKDFDHAVITGALLGLDRKFDLGLLYRNISRSYQFLYANAFTESSTPQNEEGIYISAIYRFNKQWQIQGMADFFRHPWLRFRIDSPSNGSEYFFRLSHTKKRKSLIYLQYFYEQKEQNSSIAETKTTQVVPTIRHRFRIHGNYKINRSLELRNRIEFSRFNKNGSLSSGFLMFQDIIYKSNDFPLSGSFRYALFDTDNFDNRIYAFENDLLYEFSIPAFFNRGFRTYLNLRYRVNRNLTAEFRVSRTFLNDLETIGSALNEINGNTRTDVKAQLRFKF